MYALHILNMYLCYILYIVEEKAAFTPSSDDGYNPRLISNEEVVFSEFVHLSVLFLYHE